MGCVGKAKLPVIQFSNPLFTDFKLPRFQALTLGSLCWVPLRLPWATAFSAQLHVLLFFHLLFVFQGKFPPLLDDFTAIFFGSEDLYLTKVIAGTSLMAPVVRFHAPNAGSTGSRTRIPHAAWCTQIIIIPV